MHHFRTRSSFINHCKFTQCSNFISIFLLPLLPFSCSVTSTSQGPMESMRARFQFSISSVFSFLGNFPFFEQAAQLACLTCFHMIFHTVFTPFHQKFCFTVMHTWLRSVYFHFSCYHFISSSCNASGINNFPSSVTFKIACPNFHLLHLEFFPWFLSDVSLLSLR